MAVLAALRFVGFLNVFSEYAGVILSRRPCNHNHLVGLVTKAGEKCGLATSSIPLDQASMLILVFSKLWVVSIASSLLIPH
jgi:hypothetical protein